MASPESRFDEKLAYRGEIVIYDLLKHKSLIQMIPRTSCADLNVITSECALTFPNSIKIFL